MRRRMDLDQYIEDTGNGEYCPFCGSGVIQSKPVFDDAYVLRVDYLCTECERVWEEFYSMTDVAEVV